jgi:hypothetical protein
MYATCLQCHSRLGANDVIEPFPVGRHLAFDAAKGRLWVVCASCGSWNLSPIEERWEAIECAERIFRATRVRVTTANIGLARLKEGLELVRIGAPLRPEFAAWRYGARFRRRRKNTQLGIAAAATAAGIGAIAFSPILVPAMTMGALSIVVLPGVTTFMGVIPAMGILTARDYMQNERVVGRLLVHHHRLVGRRPRVVTVRAKHIAAAQLQVHGDDAATVTLDVPHDTGWAHFDGLEAMQASTTLLAGANRFGATEKQVQEAVDRVEEHGDAATYLRAACSLGDARNSRMTSLLNLWRRLGAMHLSTTECLALEMSLHEEAERRALEGEIALLEAAWRDAETVAAIADSL